MLRSERRLIHAVVFDLGAVLIGWDPRNLYRKLTGDEAKIEYFLSQICTPEWNSRQDAGRPFAEAVSELKLEHPEFREWIELYHSRWHEMISGPIDGAVEILEELARARKVRLFALTNWSGETFPYALKTFPFLARFEGIVVSGVEKLIKPDPELYQILLRRYHLNSKQVAFIDDVDRNVEAARALGFCGLVFTTPDRLRGQLEQMGLLNSR